MAKAALEAGKHVLCEKPLAMTSKESAELVELAREDRLAAGVNYNIRFYPLCLEARERGRGGQLGKVFPVCGSYVQDWLLHDTDYNWRVLADEGGELRAVADIGTHWLDLVHAITGLEVEAVCADLRTVHPVRQRPKGEVETFSGKVAKSSRHRAGGDHHRRLRLRHVALQGRGARLLVGLAGHGRPQELPALRDRGGEGRPGLEQREPERAVDRPSRQAERAAAARSGAPLGTRASSGGFPAATTRASRTRSSSASARSTATSRRATSRPRRTSPPSRTATARSSSARPS